MVVRVEIDGSAEGLRPAAAQLWISISGPQDSLYCPGAFLVSASGCCLCSARGQGCARDVRLGIMEGNFVQILEGLEAGELVITSSYDEYRHKEEIRVNPQGGRMQ